MQEYIFSCFYNCNHCVQVVVAPLLVAARVRLGCPERVGGGGGAAAGRAAAGGQLKRRRKKGGGGRVEKEEVQVR